jgi:cyclic pyranopterin monophosphate synthase
LARMVDIGGKPAVERLAVAAGRIRLRAATVEAIRRNKVKKGDVLSAAQLSGIQAAKRTADFIPLCHPVPLTSLAVELSLDAGGVSVRCESRARYGTGVEMEALCGVAGALLCVWDMVKYLEKDGSGNYPATAIEGIRVLRKVKGKAGAGRRTRSR